MIQIPVSWLRPISIAMLLITVPFFFYLGWKNYSEQEKFLDSGILTTASILNITERCSTFIHRGIFPQTFCSHLVTYEYEVDDEIYVTEEEKLQNTEIFEIYENESEADIYYLPNSPSRSLLTKNRLQLIEFFSTVLLSTGVCSLGIAWKPAKRGQRRTQVENIFFYSVPFIAYFIVATYLLLAKPLKDGSHSSIVLLFMITVGIIFAAYLAGWATLYHSMKNINSRRVSNITSKNVPIPADKQYMWKGLRELGFSRLCETYEETGFGTSHVNRYFYLPPYKTTAVINDQVSILGFFSFFWDDTVLQTTFPFGENIDALNFRSRFTDESIEAAFQLHIKELEDFENRHGSPALVENIGQILHWLRVYDQKHSAKVIQKEIRFFLIETFALGLLLLLMASYFVLRDVLSEQALQAYFLVGFFITIFMLNIPSWIKNYRRRVWQ